MDDYYVYVYIDPRNLEEFYFGKGRGSRKDAHLSDKGDSEKARRIGAIRKAGLNPTIRVIARGLSEHDALRDTMPRISDRTTPRISNSRDSTTSALCITTTSARARTDIGMTIANWASSLLVRARAGETPCSDFRRVT